MPLVRLSNRANTRLMAPVVMASGTSLRTQHKCIWAMCRALLRA